ncbi:MAG TPA: hypothetical protein ENO21_03345 [Firmicutes bacterium]|nr:hypothetical protein [Bacillota bacterium]
MVGGRGKALGNLAYGFVYAACALAAAIILPLRTGNLSELLPPEAMSPAAPVLLALPALVGLALQLAGRRLWTWPYVYLLSLYLVHTATAIDTADKLYLYSSQLAALLTIALAESLGLSIGRWFNRPAAIGYFAAVGVIQIVYAFDTAQGPLPLWIKQLTFNAGGALFLVQAAIQLYINRRAEAARQPGTAEGGAAELAETEAGDEPPVNGGR